ncbi:hypothetical protein [Rathayibacter sp. AY1D9]|uniref:hypothetical protein n=1 Tax=Rathayibacter sp. AY1D9 TaxID=2080548 RepID=UPI0011B05FAF|nr:hypothetical protein [Rathayibacter sp. AY1D9]
MAFTPNTFIHGSARYQVTGVVVVADSASQPNVYIYRHGILPADTNPLQIERLLEANQIVELQEVTA